MVPTQNLKKDQNWEKDRIRLKENLELQVPHLTAGMIELPFDAGFSDSDSLELAELSTVFPVLF